MEEEVKFDLKELYDLEEKNGKKFDYIRFSCADMNGISRTNTVPRRHAEDDLVKGFSNFVGRTVMSSYGVVPMLDEIIEAKHGNGTHFACKNTLYECLWAGKDFKNKNKRWEVAEVLCEMKWPAHYRGGSMVEACPRYALRKQLYSLQQLGFQLMSAFELEFCLLDPLTLDPIYPHKNNMSTLLHSEVDDFCYTIEKSCAAMGVGLNALMIESAPSELELVMEPKFGIESSDNAFSLREAVKEIGSSFNYLPTFMSYHRAECFNPSSAHLNLSLWTEDAQGKRTNAFYDANDPENISTVFRHFLAGLIKHSRALCAFWCPTVNCYRRLNNFKLPPRSDWDFNNRKTTFRIKNESNLSPYLEIRRPSSACNYYLVTAASLVAGMDGIKKQLPLLPNDSTENVPLPKSFDEALEALEANEVLKEGLGRELVNWFVQLKKNTEINPLKSLSEEDKMEMERKFFLYPF